MTTNKPPDLAAIRARSEAAESGPWLDYQQDVRALLDYIDRLRAGIQSIIDNDRSDYSWITMDLEDLLG